MKINYLAFAAVVIAGVLLWACDDELTNDGCDDGTTRCGDVCCPNDDYTCSNGECVLVGCDAGLYLCGPGCVPLTADCCDPNTGAYCNGEVCCDNGCMPVGASCCGNGTYCPAGSVCCDGGCC